jgi:hypothetical protein
MSSVVEVLTCCRSPSTMERIGAPPLLLLNLGAGIGLTVPAMTSALFGTADTSLSDALALFARPEAKTEGAIGDFFSLMHGQDLPPHMPGKT